MPDLFLPDILQKEPRTLPELNEFCSQFERFVFMHRKRPDLLTITKPLVELYDKAWPEIVTPPHAPPAKAALAKWLTMRSKGSGVTLWAFSEWLDANAPRKKRENPLGHPSTKPGPGDTVLGPGTGQNRVPKARPGPRTDGAVEPPVISREPQSDEGTPNTSHLPGFQEPIREPGWAKRYPHRDDPGNLYVPPIQEICDACSKSNCPQRCLYPHAQSQTCGVCRERRIKCTVGNLKRLVDPDIPVLKGMTGFRQRSGDVPPQESVDEPRAATLPLGPSYAAFAGNGQYETRPPNHPLAAQPVTVGNGPLGRTIRDVEDRVDDLATLVGIFEDTTRDAWQAHIAGGGMPGSITGSMEYREVMEALHATQEHLQALPTGEDIRPASFMALIEQQSCLIRDALYLAGSITGSIVQAVDVTVEATDLLILCLERLRQRS
ncbi:hypothetical protein NMY22_g7992 [Coprinellus aureogranulatus]|nr:hypothetical protein NMY22_g7992 [Coprinellus aureogranulatus]